MNMNGKPYEANHYMGKLNVIYVSLYNVIDNFFGL